MNNFRPSVLDEITMTGDRTWYSSRFCWFMLPAMIIVFELLGLAAGWMITNGVSVKAWVPVLAVAMASTAGVCWGFLAYHLAPRSVSKFGLTVMMFSLIIPTILASYR